MKEQAINFDVSGAPAVSSGVEKFVRTFQCETGDRLVPTSRAYVYIKVRDNGLEKNILSDRFVAKDNRITAYASGAFFKIECKFVQDAPGETLPVREESLEYSK